MGVQPKEEKVLRLIEDNLWEDDETVATEPSTDVSGTEDGEIDDEESGDEWEDKNRYLDPPVELLYNGKGEPSVWGPEGRN